MTNPIRGPKEFKRLNFFTGFYTTAEDWNAGGDYQLEKRRLHNRGLHTPGVIRGGLQVTAAGGLRVGVSAGSALDAAGNDVYLGVGVSVTLDPSEYADGDTAYLAVRYHDQPSDYVHNVENEAYSGFTRTSEIPVLGFSAERPDNEVAIELARVLIEGSPAAVSNPADPASPGPNEVDTTHVRFAGAVLASTPERLTETERQRVVQSMMATRRAFATLEARFPTPSQADVRHAAMSIEMLARVDAIAPDRFISVMAATAAAEQDVKQELPAHHPALIARVEYGAFAAAVDALLAAIDDGDDMEALLVAQDAAAQAARELSEIAMRRPQADAGDDVEIQAVAGEAIVTLDAGRSEAFDDQHITRYVWSLRGSESPPRADAGADQEAPATDGEAQVTLDASRSRAYRGRTIERYRWTKRD